MTARVIPAEVERLAAEREQARAVKDWAASDKLRERIAELGWAVTDGADGQHVAGLPPYRVLANVREVPERSAQADDGRATVALLVEGWPDDVRECVTAVLAHTPEDVRVLLLENGPTDAGVVVHELAADPRVEELHLGQGAGWAEARNALSGYDTAAVHVVMDPSSVLTGDALAPLLAALVDPAVAAAGWRGVRVQDGWTAFEDAPAGEVEALLSYLIAVRRGVLRRVPFPAKARFYRNADMEWSFLVREAGLGRLVAVDVPVRQERHRGYHDSDPDFRDRESKKTYDRFLARFRGREELRLMR